MTSHLDCPGPAGLRCIATGILLPTTPFTLEMADTVFLVFLMGDLVVFELMGRGRRDLVATTLAATSPLVLASLEADSGTCSWAGLRPAVGGRGAGCCGVEGGDASGGDFSAKVQLGCTASWGGGGREKVVRGCSPVPLGEGKAGDGCNQSSTAHTATHSSAPLSHHPPVNNRSRGSGKREVTRMAAAAVCGRSGEEEI